MEFEVVEIPKRAARVRPARVRSRTPRPSRSAWTPTTTFLCPNCEERWHPPSLRPWYCSLRCRCEAEVVRYGRKRALEYPDGFPPDIKAAIQTQLAHALAGGYDVQARRLSPETRAAVIKRDKGVCRMCGAPGEEIDHIDGSSADLSNLRLLCKTCHEAVTRAHFVPITDEDTRERQENLLVRMYSPEPLFACDDANWNEVRKEWRRANTQIS